MLSGRGCLSAKGDGSQSSTWMAESCGDDMAIMRGNVGSGMVGCGDRGSVRKFRWFMMATSMISTAMSSTAVMVGEGVEVVTVVREEGEC